MAAQSYLDRFAAYYRIPPAAAAKLPMGRLGSFMDEVAQNPQLRQLVAAYKQAKDSGDPAALQNATAQLDVQLSQRGIPSITTLLDKGVEITDDNQLRGTTPWWANAAPIVGGAIVGGGALGLLGGAPAATAPGATATGATAAGAGAGAGVTAGTGAGVGIGETAAVTGITPALGGSLGVGSVAGSGISSGAALSAPSWLSPILKDSLPAIIGAGGQLGGAAIAAHGNTEAAKIQDAFAREALAYEKERDKYGSATEANRYAAMMSGLSPYVDTGADADVRMAQLLGLPAPQPRATTAPPPQYATPNLPGTPPSAAPANPAGQTAQAVQMRAPDGSTQSVPPDQAAHYEQRGAVRV